MGNDSEANQAKLAEVFINYLGCPCQYFPKMETDTPILEAYHKAQERGKKEGFVPMLVVVDEILWESLVWNADANIENNEDPYSFNKEAVAEYRKKILDTPLESGKALLEKYLREYHIGNEDDEDMGWDEDFLAETDMVDTIPEDAESSGFMGYGSRGQISPLILAEIPTKNPWEVFAYLPFGGWNACPDTLNIMAAAKYWYEVYQAVPAVVTHDVLEFELPKPVEEEKAAELAKEQYVFCTDIVDQGVGTIGNLAAILAHMNTWYFWWD